VAAERAKQRCEREATGEIPLRLDGGRCDHLDESQILHEWCLPRRHDLMAAVASEERAVAGGEEKSEDLA